MNTKRRPPVDEPEGQQPAGQEDDYAALDELTRAVHGPSEHPTREQDAHPSAHGIDQEQFWMPEMATESPPPRPGYVQRMVKTSLRGTEDPGHVAKMMRLGWKPRPADSIPGLEDFPKRSDGRFSGYIGTHDLVLCEMPVAQAQRIAAYFKEKSDAMIRGVQETLQALGAETGTKFTQERKSQVVRGGRRPIVAANPGSK